MSSPSLLFKLFLGTLAFSVLGSAISSHYKMDPGPVAPVCSAIFIVTGSLLVLRELTGVLRYALLFFGASVEIVGMYTGWIFGRYHYTHAWFPVLSLPGGEYFPLLVPFAWVFVAGGSYLTVRTMLSGNLAVLATGILASQIDAPMEQAMTKTFGYWTWESPAPPYGAPTQNTIGWFCVAAIAAFLMAKSVRPLDGAKYESPVSLGLFGAFVAYVGWLGGFHPAWPALAGVSVIPLYFAFRPTFSR